MSRLRARVYDRAIETGQCLVEEYPRSILNRGTGQVVESASDLSRAVQRALRRENASAQEIANPKADFERRYGCVDGYEDFRLFIMLLEDVNFMRLRGLRRLYERIPATACPVTYNFFQHDRTEAT